MGNFKTWMFARRPSPPKNRRFFHLRALPGNRAAGRGRLADDRRQLARFWPVMQNMVISELRVRYQRSLLGFVWTLLNPLLMMMTLSWAFSHLFKAIPNYTYYLFAGMVPWGFLSGSLNECALCIMMNEGLIRKIYVPSWCSRWRGCCSTWSRSISHCSPCSWCWCRWVRGRRRR